jgi:hypothetical protein
MSTADDTHSSSGAPEIENSKVTAPSKPRGWKRFFGSADPPVASSGNSIDEEPGKPPLAKWSMGILNDTKTEEVPGMNPPLPEHGMLF